MKKNVYGLKNILFFSIVCIIFLAVSVSLAVLNSAEVSAYTKSTTFYEAPNTGTRAVRTITQQYAQPVQIKRVGVSLGQYAPKESRFQEYVPPVIIPSITIFPVLFDPAAHLNETIKVTPVAETAKDLTKLQEEAKETGAGRPGEAEEAGQEEKSSVKQVTMRVTSEKIGLFVSPKAGTYITSSIFIGGLLLYFLILWIKG